jgi:hypothetical protein
MRPILTSAILLLATTLLHAQDLPAGIAAAPKPKPTPKARLTGHVLCNDTRQPARGATVMLQPIPPKDAPSDQYFAQPKFGRVTLDGSYTISHVPPGDYAVLALFPGYLSPIDNVPMFDDPDEGIDPQKALIKSLEKGEVIHIPADGTQTADVMLERGAAISGRVLYSDGAPASQVSIQMEDVNAKPNPKAARTAFDMGSMYRSVFTHQTLSTDDQGRFRVSGIRPGTYRIAVVQPISFADLESGGGNDMGEAIGMSVFGSGGDPRSIHFYAGDTFHKKSAKTYELRPGDTLNDLDIRLPIDGFQEVRVHLSAPDGRAINSAQITLTDTTDDAIHFNIDPSPARPIPSSDSAAITGHDDGIYEFHSVPPGTYALTITAAQILALHTGPPQPGQFPPNSHAANMVEITTVIPTATYTDTTSTVIVKDSSTTDLNLTLTPATTPTAPPP